MSSAVWNLIRWAGERIALPDARILLADTLGVPLNRLLLAPDPNTIQMDRFAELVAARHRGVPVQYLTGRAPFRTVEVAVGPGVFIPRPETEVMVGWALRHLSTLPPTSRVVELCAGTGAISKAIATEHPGLDQYAVELSELAVDYAVRNLAGTGVEVHHEDMATALADLDGTVDVVIANPPYIPLEAFVGIPAEVRDHEPTLALFSGEDGLDAIRVVAEVAFRLLRPGGVVAAEHAEVQQDSAVAVFVDHGGFDAVRDHRDLNHRPRFVTARRIGAVAG